MNRRHTGLALLPTLLAAACAEDPFISPKPGSDDPPSDTDPGLGLPSPRIQVDPPLLAFGELPPGCPIEKEVVIRNVGERPLVVDTIDLRGPDPHAFVLSTAGPLRLAPGEATGVVVGFEAPSYAPYAARLVVTSNDPVDPVVRVPAEGTGAEAAFLEEVFIQEQVSAVDVLWVIDTSCSMDPYQQTVAQAMGTFIQGFVNLGLDWHIAVTTTDMDNDVRGSKGRFVGPVITPRTPDPVREFRDQTVLGSRGSAIERGFAGARAALTPPLVNTTNAGFLRQDATLAIVVVADEDDRDAHDENTGQQRPHVTDDFVAWLRSMKPNPLHTTFSGYTRPPSGSARDSAPQYHRAIAATGGVYAEITRSDVRPFLTHLSFTAAGLVDRFQLAEVPTSASPTAITVKVDGRVVPFGVVDGWTFDAAANTVILWGSAIPGPGDLVEIRYPYELGCD